MRTVQSDGLKKDNRDIREFVKDEKRLAHAQAPLREAAAVNSTRWALYRKWQDTGPAVESGTGGRTKWNRTRLDIPKTHAPDACVGEAEAVSGRSRPTLRIKCTGRGACQRTRVDACGFPRGILMREKQIHGFRTGDMVRANVPEGRKQGQYVGRVAVRATGYFNIQTAAGVVQGVPHRHGTLVQRADGYAYQ